MTIKAFRNEEAVQVEGDTLRLVLDFAAIDATEALVGRPYSEVLTDVMAGRGGEALTGKVLWGLLRRHHGDLTIDQVVGLLFGAQGVVMGAAVARLFDAAFPAAEAVPQARPPQPSGASAPS